MASAPTLRRNCKCPFRVPEWVDAVEKVLVIIGEL
jgi:hypothetical protein